MVKSYAKSGRRAQINNNKGISTPTSLLMGQELVQSFEAINPPDKAFYLYGEIEEEVEYVDMIHYIRYASPDQQITIHINGPGGCISSCLAIINAIKASEAEIITVLDGEACSASAFIWLAGHRRVIASKHVYLMVHEAGWAMRGNASEHQRHVTILKKVVADLVDDIGSWVITDEEKDDFLKGIDIYISGDQIIERGTKAQEQADGSAGEEPDPIAVVK